MNLRRSIDNTERQLFGTGPETITSRGILSEDAFHKMISRERRRTERSHKPFLLVLLDMGDEMPAEAGSKCLENILRVLSSSTRETDVAGWYKNGLVVGVLFIEIEQEEKKHILNTMLLRTSSSLQDKLTFEEFNQITISFYWFPEEWADGVPKRPSRPVLYPDLTGRGNGKGVTAKVKRLMDIVGSLLALVILSPLLLAIAVAIKLTSKGPVIFRQERLGQFGKTFTCLKFRSMYAGNDVSIHKDFIKGVIHGTYDGKEGNGGAPVYKMTDDPRTTRVGRFLRRTSLDEAPQFINILKGEMSLVGPRPPLAYEFQHYDLWHRRRVLEVKPGLTGLWQVKGRSHICFDDMVRLDLRYIRSWSIWLDLQILLQTPKAVFLGHDAF